jgi:hypothetical protein
MRTEPAPPDFAGGTFVDVQSKLELIRRIFIQVAGYANTVSPSSRFTMSPPLIVIVCACGYEWTLY